MIGTVFGHYRVTRKLGQGGVGDVWKAIDLSLDREVALKVLRPDLAAQPELVARFRAEALALAKLNHPHIAAIYGFHVEDACPFMVMECVQGQTLDAVVRASGRMELARALPLFYQVLDAIQHAHEQGIVHRDLKASNVMLSQLGVIKVLDFGIARQVGSVHLTRGTHGVGTPSWMAPEQIRAEEADARTDVYALGLLLYWLVAARLPFEGDSEFAVQRAHLEQEAASPRVHAPDLPGAVEKAILRALAKDRVQRFASVAELRRELGERREPTRLRVLPLGVALDALALEADDTLVTRAAGGAPPEAPSADVPTRILAESSDEEREAAGGGATGGERHEAPAAPVHGGGLDVAAAPRVGSPVGTTARPARRAWRLPLAWAAAALLAACAMLGVWASAPREQRDRPSAQRPSPAGVPGFSIAPGSATTTGSETEPGSARAPEPTAPAPPAAPDAHDAAAKPAPVAARPAARKQRSAQARSEDRWVIRRD